jgi:Galactose oxidase, central domain
MNVNASSRLGEFFQNSLNPRSCPSGRFIRRSFLCSFLITRIGFWLCLGILINPFFGSMAAGAWTPLANLAPDGVELMLLLPDGTVMAAEEPGGTNYSAGWFLLTPDIHGSYINGTWSRLTSMHYTRLDYSSIVLTNGQVWVAGGEYGTGTATSEVYDPLSNTWTIAPVPVSLLNPALSSPEVGENQGFYDSISKILPDGRVLIAPDGANTIGGTLIFDPSTYAWSAGPTTFKRGYPDQAEASWVKLPDDSILTVDPSTTNSERYIPSLNEWIQDANLPVNLCTNGEIGPAVLLPNGKAFFLGASGHTALYTPSGNLGMGTWIAGPDIPNDLSSPDAPAASMSNGKVLCSVGPFPIYSAPSSFYEYDWVSNSFSRVNGPTGPTYYAAPYYTKMLDLPDGSVLFSTGGNRRLYVYRPDGSPVASGRSVISDITYNAVTGVYLLTGKGLNGISEGATYGDDAQMDSNYPLVRMADDSNNVYYARTYDWTATSVMATNRLVTVQFVLPGNLPPAKYSLVAVANGIASDPVSLQMPLLLQIAPNGISNIVLTWPAFPSNIALEKTATLASPDWIAVTNSPTRVGDNLVLTYPATSTATYFRLHITDN